MWDRFSTNLYGDVRCKRTFKLKCVMRRRGEGSLGLDGGMD